MSKILNNLPIENLSSENDYLGIIDKGEIIRAFLVSNKGEFKKIKMFSLYGEWGSGKSTLMKYLEKELKTDYNTFFFEAWQYESDSNLSLSLLEYLSYKSSDSTEEALGEIVSVAAKLFKGFSKSVRISIPGLISIDGNKLVESLEEEPKETFYQLKEKFQTEFKRFESHITRENNPNYNIVFIDDLDRCEPENVLNLLSALKLFFTYGEKTIFFCGIDKKAIKEAVRTKYGEVVKANEYLEKVFDISFSMPVHDDLFTLVSKCFKEEKLNGINNPLENDISEFFKALHFTNPRRVKKVLNKFLIIKNLKEQKKIDLKHNVIIPEIITKNGGNYLETVIVLYLIIINEFYSSILEDSFNLDLKLKVFEKAIEQNARLSNSNNIQSHVATSLSKAKEQFSFIINKIVVEKVSLFDILNNKYSLTANHARNNNFIERTLFLNVLFCPSNITSMVINSLNKHEIFKSTFRVENIFIDYYFMEYLLNLFNKSKDFKNLSLTPIIEFKNIIKTLS